MNKLLTAATLALVLALPTQAADRITREQIQQVIRDADAAAVERDAAAIGVYLSHSFEKIVEFEHKEWMTKVRINKDEYLAMIDAGWAGIGDYNYQRDNIKIHLMPNGQGGLSYSTITEHMFLDGMEMTSRIREFATYGLENSRLVITEVSSHPLLGDTTPQ